MQEWENLIALEIQSDAIYPQQMFDHLLPSLQISHVCVKALIAAWISL